MKKMSVIDLSVKELLAMTVKENLAEELLRKFGSLKNIVNAGVEELHEVGVGYSTANRLKAILELSRRCASETNVQGIIRTPKDVYDMFTHEMQWLDREVFRCLYLNTKNVVISSLIVSVGTLASCQVHPREVYKGAISRSAAGIIAVHNHPSGDPTPSQDDLMLTNRLKEAGELIGISLIDHLIIGNGRYVSLKERGQL